MMVSCLLRIKVVLMPIIVHFAHLRLICVVELAADD